MVNIEELYSIGTKYILQSKPSLFNRKLTVSLAFGQTQFGAGQTKKTQLISCAQLLSFHIQLHIRWAAGSFDSVQLKWFSKMTFIAHRCAMSVPHFLSAAINTPTASNYNSQADNKHKWNLHFLVLFSF